MVVLNFTLQFLELAERRIAFRIRFHWLESGGAGTVGKFSFTTLCGRAVIQHAHHFKRANGYSELRSARRSMLGNVMLTDSVETHKARAPARQQAGFEHSELWFSALISGRLSR